MTWGERLFIIDLDHCAGAIPSTFGQSGKVNGTIFLILKERSMD
jgi:hypothetical protein